MRETCGLRFTVDAHNPQAGRCPICHAPTEPVGLPFQQAAVPQAENDGLPPGPVLNVILDNIRSAWNVGSMMRTADGAGVCHVYLCGVSPTPDNPKVAKTALGAEKSLPWSFHANGVEVARKLKDEGVRLWALEGGERSVPLYHSEQDSGSQHAPLALVVGNELTGVDPGLLELCERVVNLPMLGVKGSLNVAVAFGIAVYSIRFGLTI